MDIPENSHPIGENMVQFGKNGSFYLANTQTGRVRCLVNEKGGVEVADKDIDYESIHHQLEHCANADRKMAPYWFGRYDDFRGGVAALSWTLYPEGRYFEDEDGFGGEDNEEEKVFCVINTNLEIIVPFRPMEDVRRVLAGLQAE